MTSVVVQPREVGCFGRWQAGTKMAGNARGGTREGGKQSGGCLQRPATELRLRRLVGLSASEWWQNMAVSELEQKQFSLDRRALTKHRTLHL